MNDPVLTAHEVADVLHRHVVTVRRLIKRGELVGVKRGAFWYVRQSALDEFLRADTTHSAHVA